MMEPFDHSLSPQNKKAALCYQDGLAILGRAMPYERRNLRIPTKPKPASISITVLGSGTGVVVE